MRRILTITYTWARRCVIALVGGTVVIVGIIMIVTPGPAFVVIPAGLAILGIEFACARRWLQQLRSSGTKMLGRTRLWLKPKTSSANVQTARAWREATIEPVVTRSAPLKANRKTGYYRAP